MRTKHLQAQTLLFAALATLGLALFAPGVSFAVYPDHTIQLIIPYVPGATGDITGRLMADELGQILGQKIIPNNKPGAGTVLGADAAIRAKRDGYTLFYGGASWTVYAPISNPESIHYNPTKDMEPLGFHYFFPTVVGVRADAPWKTFAQFVDYAKKNPGKIRISSIGTGSSPHFHIEMLQMITGIKLTHVPFEGGESVVTAVMGGHVEATLDGYGKLKPHVDGGRMRILLIDPKKPDHPEIPTLTELGYKQGLPASWFAFWAPAGIPEEARKVLIPAIEKAVRITKPKVEAIGSICEYKSPADQKKLRDDEYKQISEVAGRMGFTVKP